VNDTTRLAREGAASLRVRNLTRHAGAVEQITADNSRMRAALNEIVAAVRLDWHEHPDPDAGHLVEKVERIATKALGV
jgi:hypothetical protein